MFFVGWSTWVWKQPTSCETCPRNCGILSLDSNMDHSLRIWPGPVLKLKLKKIEHEVCGETLPGYHLLHSGAIGVFYTCKCSRASWTNKTNQKKCVFQGSMFVHIHQLCMVTTNSNHCKCRIRGQTTLNNMLGLGYVVHCCWFKIKTC